MPGDFTGTIYVDGTIQPALLGAPQCTPQLNETVKHNNRESDRHGRRYMCVPSLVLPIYETTCHAKPYLCCCCFCCCCSWWCCYCTPFYWLVLRDVFFLFLPTLLQSYTVMDVVVQNPQKISWCDQGTTMRKTCES